MTTQCEFCDKPDVKNHLLECEMVLGHLFGGETVIAFPEETSVQLVVTVKKPKKLPLVRWKNLVELARDLRGETGNTSTMMYT